MDHFVLVSDDFMPNKISFSIDKATLENEMPKVIYTDSKFESSTLPDFICNKKIFEYSFFVSDPLKELLEIYDDSIVFTPYFLTENTLKKQVVYWHIQTSSLDCHITTKSAKEKEISYPYSSVNDKYIYRIRFEKLEYMVVSLHLAENMLRKNFVGIGYKRIIKEGDKCYYSRT